MTTEMPAVLTAREGAAGVIRLNRPKAMNALTLAMVRLMRGALDGFLADPGVGLVILEAVEGRAFCAGGDIRACAESGRAGDGVAEAFWREEYELISRLASSAKPVVALMDGIVMGGGAGLATHLRHRVVTENVRFAMPEVAIGFLPDVGATCLLPRAPRATGRYLALTGESVAVGDMLAAGLADHAVAAADLAALRRALVGLPVPATHAAVAAVLRQSATKTPAELFARHGDLIARAFAKPDVAAILAELHSVPAEEEGHAFAAATAATLAARSPWSLAVTVELLRQGAGSTLEACLLREFRVACHCLRTPDFYEGVRAAIIDKDRRPQWPSKQPGADLPVVAEVLAAHSGHPDPDFPPA